MRNAERGMRNSFGSMASRTAVSRFQVANPKSAFRIPRSAFKKGEAPKNLARMARQ
jgi:hypothetical protein